jgi:hypothetical protein
METIIAFLIFAALLAFDLLATRAGLPVYFRFGLPVFYARRRLPESRRPLPKSALKALAMRFHGRPEYPSIEFLDLANTPPVLQAAMRERLFENRAGFRFLPVMRGLARHDPTSKCAAVVGWLNLWVLFTLGYLIYRASTEASYIPVAILILFVLGVSYYVQASVYRQVADTLQALPAAQDGPHGL